MSNVNKPLVSVIMAEYNTKVDDLKLAIASILSQTFVNFELIIVDDCGSNNVISIVEKYKDRRIRVIKNKKNKGLVYSLNRAVEEAKTDYLVRMDTDDIASPDRIKRIYEFITSHPEYTVVGSRAMEFSESGDIGILCKSGEKTKETLIRGDGLVHPSVIMRKDAVLAVGGYPDYKRAEDIALWSELLLKGNRLYVMKDVLLKYRVNTQDYSKRKLKYRGGEIKARLHYYPKLGAKPVDYAYILKSVIAGLLPVSFVKYYRHKIVLGRGENDDKK